MPSKAPHRRIDGLMWKTIMLFSDSRCLTRPENTGPYTLNSVLYNGRCIYARVQPTLYINDTLLVILLNMMHRFYRDDTNNPILEEM
jgi:hypothetical protein